MFRKLRIQFVAVVMASVALVLAIVFAGICIAEYQRSLADVNEALSSSISRADEHMGKHSIGFGPMGLYGTSNGQSGSWPMFRGRDDSSSSDTSAYPAYDEHDETFDEIAEEMGFENFDEMMNGPRIGGRDDDRKISAVPVAVYLLNSSELQIVSGFTTASLSSEVLQSAFQRLADADDGEGTLGDLGIHYKKVTTDNATYFAFADTSNTKSWQSLALMLLVAGVGMLVVFFFFALFLSKWALKPVQEAWESQRQFVADASHDLKTPLTVILANASILLKHPERTIASESQWIESTQIEAEQMQGLVNEMLELAQVEAGQTVASAPFEPIDFSDLVNGETLLFDSMALERGCLFDCSIEDGIQVNGNPQQLHKMVSTLVENAFKYVNENGSIRVGLVRNGNTARLDVNNTGSEISPEDLPHIFDRFYRTDKARTSGTGGFGLGLAIAREVARSHGGDITCTSNSADGTTFTVTLPTA